MKKDYVEQVAGKIIEQLEQGTAPWQKPWEPGSCACLITMPPVKNIVALTACGCTCRATAIRDG